MANTSISFYKGESFSTYETGAVYFETATHTIKVATSETAADIYCGVRSATLGSDSKLTIVNENGNSIILDFSDIASASTLATLLSNVGDVANLNTEAKTVVGAINELKSTPSAIAVNLKDVSTASEYFTASEIELEEGAEDNRFDGITNLPDVAFDVYLKDEDNNIKIYSSHHRYHGITLANAVIRFDCFSHYFTTGTELSELGALALGTMYSILYLINDKMFLVGYYIVSSSGGAIVAPDLSNIVDADLEWSGMTSDQWKDMILNSFGDPNQNFRMGTDELDTEAETISGAINELKSRIDAIDNTGASYELILNDDGSLQCIKNGTDEGFVLNSDGSISLG